MLSSLDILAGNSCASEVVVFADDTIDMGDQIERAQSRMEDS